MDVARKRLSSWSFSHVVVRQNEVPPKGFRIGKISCPEFNFNSTIQAIAAHHSRIALRRYGRGRLGTHWNGAALRWCGRVKGSNEGTDFERKRVAINVIDSINRK
jgi:hypothetical protein